MTDLDEGRLKAWLDGEIHGPEARELVDRVGQDPATRRKVDALRARQARVDELLGRLDSAAPTARVRATVSAERARAGAPAAGRAGHPLRLWTRLGRPAQAAALVLMLAGAASAAIPGSPVREWILRALADETSPATTPARPAPSDTGETGLSVRPDGGRVRVELEGLPPGAEIRVTLVDGDRAAVYAPRGSRLEAELGRIQARVVDGPVRVELPRDLPVADLLVDGRVYMTKRSGGLELRVPAVDSSSTEIRLRAGS